ncbi:PREDICTED: serine/threonine-protein phosphatase 7 long form homolog [Lupinus angustifolius]|uniref:serine/threonine-protein phosphatase 7 long form homolog n=1 Tax=Lupinus angustifolius TaxID=3871 RepID=UPI00092F4C2D|nr:PREDICTED: serine/threonine-protein phosphatase 7 long form homolog [Lupinus angustifolius]
MEHLNLKPIGSYLLTMQNDHISNNVWNGIECTSWPRSCFWQSVSSEPVLQVICTTAFGKLLTLGVVEINNHLLLALTERWRSETHTFHFPCGEATVTLEDVAYQLGIPVDREVVTGVTSTNWEALCFRFLGVVPIGNELMGQRVKLTWLERTFRELPKNANKVVIQQHARAFILRIIGGFLMSDTSGSRVHLMYLPLLEDLTETFQYSWGSTVVITTNIPEHAVNIIRAMFDCMCVDQTDDDVVVEDVDEDDEDEEEAQLATRGRGKISQRNEQQLRC